MKKNLITRAVPALAILATAWCSTARADISTVVTSTTIAWPSEPNPPFYSATPLSGLSSQGVPTAAGGATADSLSETFTIATGDGTGAGTGPTTGNNYVLTGVGMVIGGYNTSVPCTLHLYDVTTNLTSNNGNDFNGSGANYNLYNTGSSPQQIGDLLGEGQGLQFINAAHSGAEQVIYLGLQNGPSTYGDEVVLASGHTYAVEVSVPTAAAPGGAGSFNWYRNSTADLGGEAMGSTSAPTPAQTRLTITSLGLAGGAPRSFALALYGSVADPSLATSANGSTNIVLTTNIWIDQFNASNVTNANARIGGLQSTNTYEATNDYSLGYLTNIWANWFGSGTTVSWDPNTDAQTNADSGSLMIVQNWTGQMEIWNQGPGNTIANPFGSSGLSGIDLGLTNFQCDVLFANGDASEVNGGVNSGNPFYGFFQFGTRTSGYGQSYWPGGAIVTAGNNNWVHVTLPFTPNTVPSEASIYDILLHIYGPYYSPGLSGSSTLWVDNIKFKALVNYTPPPPPTMGIHTATPELRIFAGSSVNTYDREEVNTYPEGDETWIGHAGATYSFTLLDFPVAPGMQCHIFLIPLNSLNVSNAPTGNEYVEYQASNNLWMVIAGRGSNLDGSSGYTAHVTWKANNANANPTNEALTLPGGYNIYTNTGNQSPVGTWTLTFNNNTSGTLTPPQGVGPLPFVISDPNVATDFGAPVMACFGLQPNSGAGEGAYIDYASISIANTANPISENFLSEAPGNTITSSGLWNITDSAYQNSVTLVTSSDPLWVTWTIPAVGYGLGISPTLPITQAPGYTFAPPTVVGSFVMPSQYNGYNTSPVTNDFAGGTNWMLIPGVCMPSNYLPVTNAYFELINPPPAN